MVDGYRVLKNRLIHDDVICPQDADAAHLAFWERIQQLTDGINRAGAYLSQGEPNIARETLAALLPKEPT